MTRVVKGGEKRQEKLGEMEITNDNRNTSLDAPETLTHRLQRRTPNSKMAIMGPQNGQ